jgi:hypothetical protein
MAINVGNFGQIPFAPGNPPSPPVPPVAAPHFYYDWNTARYTVATAAQTDGTWQVNFTANAAGDTVFLPWGLGEIHSIFLPSNAAGLRSFVTAGMSGCKLYIDRVNGTHDLVVYHANGGFGGAGPMNVEAPPLTVALNALHATAQARWTGAPFHHAFMAGGSADLGRATYNTPAVAEEGRKQLQGRQTVVFMGGTTVVGDLQAGQWHFYWQTYGSCTYTRPLTAPAGVFGKRTLGVGDLHHRVLQSAQFYVG